MKDFRLACDHADHLLDVCLCEPRANHPVVELPSFAIRSSYIVWACKRSQENLKSLVFRIREYREDLCCGIRIGDDDLRFKYWPCFDIEDPREFISLS